MFTFPKSEKSITLESVVKIKYLIHTNNVNFLVVAMMKRNKTIEI